MAARTNRGIAAKPQVCVSMQAIRAGLLVAMGELSGVCPLVTCTSPSAERCFLRVMGHRSPSPAQQWVSATSFITRLDSILRISKGMMGGEWFPMGGAVWKSPMCCLWKALNQRHRYRFVH